VRAVRLQEVLRWAEGEWAMATGAVIRDEWGGIWRRSPGSGGERGGRGVVDSGASKLIEAWVGTAVLVADVDV
jgi:hypothetical protein